MRAKQVPRISVIMAVRNEEKHIQASVSSILSQTWTDFEFLICDDGSTDTTASLLMSIDDPRVTVITHETSKGLAASLNELISISIGSLIARMDGDDVSELSRLSEQLSFLENHPQVGLVGCWHRVTDENNHVLASYKTENFDKHIRDKLMESNQFVHGSVMVQKALIEAAGGYDELFDEAEDYDLWLRLLDRTKFGKVPDFLYLWRVNLDESRLKKRARQFMFVRAAQAKYREDYDRSSYGEPSKDDWLRATQSLGKEYLAYGDFEESWKYAMKHLIIQPFGFFWWKLLGIILVKRLFKRSTDHIYTRRNQI